MRRLHLEKNPLCELHKNMQPPAFVAAEVVDHIEEHKGNERKFFDKTNLQSLCAHCHNRIKQAQERGAVRQQIGVDGWPVR